jgi:hypothetical protein
MTSKENPEFGESSFFENLPVRGADGGTVRYFESPVFEEEPVLFGRESFFQKPPELKICVGPKGAEFLPEDKLRERIAEKLDGRVLQVRNRETGKTSWAYFPEAQTSEKAETDRQAGRGIGLGIETGKLSDREDQKPETVKQWKKNAGNHARQLVDEIVKEETLRFSVRLAKGEITTTKEKAQEIASEHGFGMMFEDVNSPSELQLRLSASAEHVKQKLAKVKIKADLVDLPNAVGPDEGVTAASLKEGEEHGLSIAERVYKKAVSKAARVPVSPALHEVTASKLPGQIDPLLSTPGLVVEDAGGGSHQRFSNPSTISSFSRRHVSPGVAVVSGVVLTATILGTAGCTSPVDLVTGTPISPQDSEVAVGASPMPETPTPENPEPTVVVKNPTAEPVPYWNTDTETIKESSMLDSTFLEKNFVVNSERGYYETFYGVSSVADLTPEKQQEAERQKGAIALQVADAIAKDPDKANTFYVNTFIGAQEIKDILRDVYQIDNLDIEDYRGDTDSNTTFVTVHASPAGWNVVGWKGGRIDENATPYVVRGTQLVIGVDLDGDNVFDEFRDVPGAPGSVFNVRPLITDEGMMFVKVDAGGDILSIFDNQAFLDGSDNLWINVSELEATSPPTETPVPVEVPSFWTENQELFEQNGYNLVASSTGWEIQYKGNTVFTDKEAQNKSFTPISSDAGPTMVFTQFDEEGAVEKFYNPQVNPDFGEAEWENYLDISVDSLKPTEVSVAQVHSGQVLMSALIKNGTEQWWDDDARMFPFAIWSEAQHAGTEKEGIKESYIGLMHIDENGAIFADPTGRFLGFYETNFASEKIVVGMVQTLLSEDGKTFTMNAGYSGPILTKMWDEYTPYLQKVTFRTAGDEWFRLYTAFNDQLFMQRLLTEDYVGVRLLYEQDPNNQPWKLFPNIVEKLRQINAIMDEPLYSHEGLGSMAVDDETLRRLQFMILYPGYIT